MEWNNGTETQKFAYIHNLQGDIVALIDDTGAKVVSYTYDAWGKPLSTTGSLAATLGKLNPFRYRGYVYDEETGLYYLRSRYYNSRKGRFINCDSITGSKRLFSHNAFSYCKNMPILNSDPNGLTCEDGEISLWELGVPNGSAVPQEKEIYDGIEIGKLVDGNYYAIILKGATILRDDKKLRIAYYEPISDG